MNGVVDHLLAYGVPVLALPSPAALSPADVARRHGVDPSELVWTSIVVGADGPVAMAVSSGRSLDLERARVAIGDPTARLASLEEVRAIAPTSDADALPPLTRLLEIPVYVDAPVATMRHVLFPAGTVSVLVCLLREDLFRAEPVRVAALSSLSETGVSDLSVVAPTRRAAFTDAPLVPYHLRIG
jgi:prolyl-tRNA editing enzyme YbaK/EbsC (Cys-tRNA(Pro) deacylase)